MRSCHAPTSAEPQPDGVRSHARCSDHGVVGALRRGAGAAASAATFEKRIVVADAVQEVAVVITRCGERPAHRIGDRVGPSTALTVLVSFSMSPRTSPTLVPGLGASRKLTVA